MVNHGGQNPLEAIRTGNYVMHGKKVDNFKEIYKDLKSIKISSEVRNVDEMKKVFLKNHNYKSSNSKLKKINYLGNKIFESNIEEIKKYL